MSEAFGGNRPRDVAFVAPTFIWEVIQRCLYNAAESSLKKIRGRFDWIGNIVFADPCSRCAFEGRECTLLQHLNERPGAHATSLGGPGEFDFDHPQSAALKYDHTRDSLTRLPISRIPPRPPHEITCREGDLYSMHHRIPVPGTRFADLGASSYGQV